MKCYYLVHLYKSGYCFSDIDSKDTLKPNNHNHLSNEP